MRLTGRKSATPTSSLSARWARVSFCTPEVDINVQRFRGGFVFKAHRLCKSPNSRLESNKEEEEEEVA